MFSFLLGSSIKINSGMQLIDWGIVAAVIVILIGILIYCNRFMRSAADFLAASRCAGRYVLSISSGISSFAVVSCVGTFEMFYKAGFASTWWAMLSAPLGLILSMFAWVTYRMRETRCFTLSQFFEVRYSKKFRIVSGMITWLSGVMNYGIFPAVSVRFFIFFCRLPEHFNFLGINWDTYGVLLTIAIGFGVLFATCGGQIAIMVTDFVQGIFCNVGFIVFILFIFKLGDWDPVGGIVSWDHIESSLSTTPGESQINPFSSSKIPSFNYWYYIIGLITMMYNRGAWQGSMGYAAAAKNPHERRMSGILGTWRDMAQSLMVMLFPLAVIAIMKHSDFTAIADAITKTLEATKDSQLKEQGLVPTALSLIMPTGLLGLFVAIMFAAMLSTDDTYMHSWGSIFIQDVIMPFRKKPFTPKQHIWALRLSVGFVALCAWMFSYFYRQTEYVFMFFAITGAIVSGAGAAIIGGLYWKRGGTLGAWVGYISGAVIALTSIALQQCWSFKNGGGLGVWLNNRFDFGWREQTLAKFPINGQWVNLIGICSCVVLYVVFSLIEHYILKKPDFNLDKMLHRGIYDTAGEHVDQGKKVSWFARCFGITPEFSIGDKVIYACTIGWTFLKLLLFAVFTIQFFFTARGVPDHQWMTLWHIYLYVILIIAFFTTAWFLIGGLIDVTKLFIELKKVKQNDADDGSVVDGQNAGETAK